MQNEPPQWEPRTSHPEGPLHAVPILGTFIPFSYNVPWPVLTVSHYQLQDFLSDEAATRNWQTFGASFLPEGANLRRESEIIQLFMPLVFAVETLYLCVWHLLAFQLLLPLRARFPWRIVRRI